METRIQNVLTQTTTKTHKIQQLLMLGLTRKQVAELVTNGNYGFVQNVYAKMQLDQAVRITNNQISTGAFTRKFGIEIEGFNVNRAYLREKLVEAGINCKDEHYNHETKDYWKVITDSSIRGIQSFELVSPPLVGQAGLDELEIVCRVLENLNAKVNKSCGLHIHFDSGDIRLQTWRNIYINYAKLENTIDNFMPRSRRASVNTYCQSIKLRNMELTMRECATIKQIASVAFRGRYYKVNAQSYLRHKTIEFRQHSGTVEFEKMKNWILFLNNLVNHSKTHIIENETLEGLGEFNDERLTNYYKQRTQYLNR